LPWSNAPCGIRIMIRLARVVVAFYAFAFGVLWLG
jgi:hypothetical protein